MGHPGNEQPRGGTPRYDKVTALALYGLGKIGEKLIGQFLGRAVDQPLPELGQLAADLRLDIVFEQGAAVPFGQPATPPSPSPEIL
jgi:hypothetical protein